MADTSNYPPRPLIKFFPYSCYEYNTARVHSGVAILIKRHIKHYQIFYKFGSDTLAIKVETRSGPIILATNYTPPSRGALPDMDLRWISLNNCPTYILADLNAHHTSYDGYSEPRGEVLFRDFLVNGHLNFLGPEVGSYTTNRGGRTKPDIILGNNKCHPFYYLVC